MAIVQCLEQASDSNNLSDVQNSSMKSTRQRGASSFLVLRLLTTLKRKSNCQCACAICSLLQTHKCVYIHEVSNLKKSSLFHHNKHVYTNTCSSVLLNVFITGPPVLRVRHRLGKPENLWNQKERNGNLLFLQFKQGFVNTQGKLGK